MDSSQRDGTPPSVAAKTAASSVTPTRSTLASPARTAAFTETSAPVAQAPTVGGVPLSSHLAPTLLPTSRPPHTAVLSFDNTKAGLQSVDKAHTEAVLQEISQGSPFYENERRKAVRREETVRRLLEKNRVYDATVRSNPVLYRAVQQKVDTLERDIEASQRRWDCVFVHMDMDMFYAAVEQKKNPHLADVPFGVGSNAMLSTTNYIARQYGVRSGMAGFVGKKLCPQLLIVPADFTRYKAEAEVVRNVVRAYDPDFHSLGWDELTMELSGYLAQHFPHAQTLEAKLTAAETVMQEVRARVKEATQLTASAGIAPNALLAKLASNYNKPDGQCCLRLTTRDAVMEFMAKLKVREVSGIGKSTEAILQGLGIHTMGDLYAGRYRLQYLMTEKTYQFLFAASLGLGGFLDDSYFEAKEQRHAEPDPFDARRLSIGTERTFGQLKTRAALQGIAEHNLVSVHEEMCARALLTSQVMLKLKKRSFHVHQYTKTVAPPTDDLGVLRRSLEVLLLPLLEAYGEYRLLGVRFGKLITKADWERQTQRQRQGTLHTFFSRGNESGMGVKRPRLEYSLSSSSPSEQHSPTGSQSWDSDEDDVVVVSEKQPKKKDARVSPQPDASPPSTSLGHEQSVEVLSPPPARADGPQSARPECTDSPQESVIVVED